MKLNKTHIKLLIVLFVLLDVVARIFLKANSVTYQIFKGLGCCACGMLCFLLADGYWRSTNKFKYAFRLLLVSIICYLPFNLYENPWIMFGYGNAFRLYFPFPFNLFISMMMLMGLEKIDNGDYSEIAKKILRLICFLLAIIVSSFCAYPIYTQMLVLNYYYNKDDLRAEILCHLCVVALIFAYNIQLYYLSGNNIPMSLFFASNTLGYLLCIPLRKMYTGAVGNRKINRLLYLFYPLMLIVAVLLLKYTLL